MTTKDDMVQAMNSIGIAKQRRPSDAALCERYAELASDGLQESGLEKDEATDVVKNIMKATIYAIKAAGR